MRPRLFALLPLLALVAPLAHTAGAAGRIAGVDVSKYQHENGKLIDWQRVRGAGQTFAFIKATGGSNRTDPWFAREWAAAGKAGMIRGAYHYADPSRSADAQAAHVVEVVGSTREAQDLGIALDLETTGGLSHAALARWAHAFLSGVEKRTGRVPILYTAPYFWHTKMKDDRTFGAYPLWLANYRSTPPRPLPGWDRWTFWQHTSSFRVPGIPGLVDHDQMCCSLATLQALADGRSVTITRLWRSLGGASGQLGLPLGSEAVVPGGWGQTFERGYVASSQDGTFAVLGATYARYQATGGATGPLGRPIATEQVVAPGVWEQQFSSGRIVRSVAAGAHALYGDVLARWVKDGGSRSGEGIPVSDLIGPAQQFVGGGLYRTPTGVRFVPAAIRDRYLQLGGPAGTLGLPVSEVSPMLGGMTMAFKGGQLYDVVVAGQELVV